MYFLISCNCFMGKSLSSTTRLQELTRIVSSDKFRRPKRTKPISQIPVSSLKTAISDRLRGESERLKLKMETNEGQSRVPLARVVSDCVNRWFQETLKDAKAGDSSMQVLVGQMYYSGYGVPRDPQKGRAWMSKASKSRNSVWKVSDKHPGYNASDSDSDEQKDDVK